MRLAASTNTIHVLAHHNAIITIKSPLPAMFATKAIIKVLNQFSKTIPFLLITVSQRPIIAVDARRRVIIFIYFLPKLGYFHLGFNCTPFILEYILNFTVTVINSVDSVKQRDALRIRLRLIDALRRRIRLRRIPS